MKQIIELQDRKELLEGRSYGYGFSILKSLNEEETSFETVLAFTACKDYLNDLVYVENTKNKLPIIYGYQHKLINLFDNKDYFYNAVKAVHYKNNKEYDLKDTIEKLLISNFKNIEKILNIFETKIGLENKSSIILDEDTLIIKTPIYWSKTTALISVYTLIIRCLSNMFEGYDDFTLQEFEGLLEHHKPIITDDNYLQPSIFKFWNKLNEFDFSNIIYEDYIKLNSPTNLHNFGISSLLNKLENVKQEV